MARTFVCLPAYPFDFITRTHIHPFIHTRYCVLLIFTPPSSYMHALLIFYDYILGLLVCFLLSTPVVIIVITLACYVEISSPVSHVVPSSDTAISGDQLRITSRERGLRPPPVFCLWFFNFHLTFIIPLSIPPCSFHGRVSKRKVRLYLFLFAKDELKFGI